MQETYKIIIKLRQEMRKESLNQGSRRGGRCIRRRETDIVGFLAYE
jgi:hypothetical protein